ncbi:hypothetical protein FA95DRAFT_1558349 [Auriscalpium vulgare]|uniref:Uncharacterized protein n=1 Tax=Auriscalpium vulgare TaxID=40419 RepID=A0ACB8RVD2_9AGAM|nr:hypothetical protein FA95DRAFT_1558349 [Auriscalpium vulgare]
MDSKADLNDPLRPSAVDASTRGLLAKLFVDRAAAHSMERDKDIGQHDADVEAAAQDDRAAEEADPTLGTALFAESAPDIVDILRESDVKVRAMSDRMPDLEAELRKFWAKALAIAVDDVEGRHDPLAAAQDDSAAVEEDPTHSTLVFSGPLPDMVGVLKQSNAGRKVLAAEIPDTLLRLLWPHAIRAAKSVIALACDDDKGQRGTDPVAAAQDYREAEEADAIHATVVLQEPVPNIVNSLGESEGSEAGVALEGASDSVEADVP